VGVTNIDIVMNPMFWEGSYPGLARPMLDSLAIPVREYVPQAAR
jgi:CDP-6-deoxy-D-xylo-4-hexulose-3-dehydrase